METELKSILDGISTTVTGFDGKFNSLQKQVDAIDLATKQRLAGGVAQPSYADAFKESEDLQRVLRNRKGSAVIKLEGKSVADLMQRKTTLTETGQGFMVSGVMPIDRVPGITAEARQEHTVRDALYARPTAMAIVDYVRVTTPMTIASPVPEASTKPENQLIFTSFSEKVRTLATFIPASKQILDDISEVMGFINSSLPYYVNLAEEIQLLSGDDTGENLHGLIPQASAFNPAFLPTTPQNIDHIGAAVAQITVAKELQPTFVILHPSDWWGMRLLKDNYGRYLLGDPQSDVPPSLFGLKVIPTTSIAAKTFLVGSGNSAASEIRDRMEMVIEISTEHANFFIQNLIAIRAEKRLALVVKRAASYVVGTLS